MTRFFLPLYRKVCLGLASLAFLASAAYGQNATVIGPITPGHLAQFNSTTIIKDSGIVGPAPGIVQGPFVATPNYGASNTQTIFQGVLGSVASPNAVADAPFIFQKTTTGVTATNPTAYFSTVKTGNAPNTRAQAVFAEAVDQGGWNGTLPVSFVEGGRSQGTVGGSLGSAWGFVCAAGDNASVTYTFMIGCEGDSVNNSGVDAPVTFNKNTFIAGVLAANTGGNKADAGFATGPFIGAASAYRVGFLVGETSVDQAGFRSRASTVYGLDLTPGAQSFAAIAINNSTPITMQNAANNAALRVLFTDASNRLVIGEDSVAVLPSGGTPTISGCTGVGTTGTCTLSTGSSNNVGKITITPGGTGITAIATVTIAFSAAIGPNSSTCNFLPQQGTGNWSTPVSLIGAGATSTANAVNAANGATFTSGSTYLLGYVCFGF